MNQSPFRLGYRPELDGLRAIAVLMVMLVHAGIPLTVGGAIGVDIFFVLSGFLITYLLCREFDGTGRISLKDFYIRRLLRLSPALWLLLLAYGIYALITKTGVELVRASKIILISLFYLSDFAKAFNYSDLDKIAHTWSLAIEEHFYLLFPPLIYLLLRKGVGRYRIGIGLFVVACVVALYRLGTVLTERENFNVTRVYFGFDYHIDGLLIGCALALLLTANPNNCKKGERAFYLPEVSSVFASIATLFLTLCFLFVSNSAAIYFELLFFINLSFCLILLYILQRGNRILRLPILVWIGKISYGLYLWHSFVYEITRERFQFKPFSMLFIGGSVSFTVAVICYYLVEKPVLKFKVRFEPRIIE